MSQKWDFSFFYCSCISLAEGAENVRPSAFCEVKTTAGRQFITAEEVFLRFLFQLFLHHISFVASKLKIWLFLIFILYFFSICNFFCLCDSFRYFLKVFYSQRGCLSFFLLFCHCSV